MGCSVEPMQKPFLRLQVTPLKDVLANPREGARVHVLGHCMMGEGVIEGPFGARPVVAAWYRCSVHDYGSECDELFTCRFAVPFRLAGEDGEALYVDISAKSPCTFNKTNLERRHTEWNIHRYGAKQTFRSGGTFNGDRFGTVSYYERPCGIPFWDMFNQGKDPIENLKSERRETAKRRLCREYLLQPGDPVGVIGTVAPCTDEEKEGYPGIEWKLTNTTIANRKTWYKKLRKMDLNMDRNQRDDMMDCQHPDPNMRVFWTLEWDCYSGIEELAHLKDKAYKPPEVVYEDWADTVLVSDAPDEAVNGFYMWVTDFVYKNASGATISAHKFWAIRVKGQEEEEDFLYRWRPEKGLVLSDKVMWFESKLDPDMKVKVQIPTHSQFTPSAAVLEQAVSPPQMFPVETPEENPATRASVSAISRKSKVAFSLDPPLVEFDDAEPMVPQAPPTPTARKCACGNNYMSDSLFCRKCGKKVKKEPLTPLKAHLQRVSQLESEPATKRRSALAEATKQPLSQASAAEGAPIEPAAAEMEPAAPVADAAPSTPDAAEPLTPLQALRLRQRVAELEAENAKLRGAQRFTEQVFDKPSHKTESSL